MFDEVFDAFAPAFTDESEFIDILNKNYENNVNIIKYEHKLTVLNATFFFSPPPPPPQPS